MTCSKSCQAMRQAANVLLEAAMRLGSAMPSLCMSHGHESIIYCNSASLDKCTYCFYYYIIIIYIVLYYIIVASMC